MICRNIIAMSVSQTLFKLVIKLNRYDGEFSFNEQKTLINKEGIKICFETRNKTTVNVSVFHLLCYTWHILYFHNFVIFLSALCSAISFPCHFLHERTISLMLSCSGRAVCFFSCFANFSGKV